MNKLKLFIMDKALNYQPFFSIELRFFGYGFELGIPFYMTIHKGKKGSYRYMNAPLLKLLELK